MTDQMKQARDEKARTYGYNNAIYIDKAMLNKEGYQYLEEKPVKDFIKGRCNLQQSVLLQRPCHSIPV